MSFVAITNDKCDMQPKFARPRSQFAVEVFGGICECGENENFSNRLAFIVHTRLGGLFFDDGVQLRELTVAVRVHVLSFFEKELKLSAIVANCLQPLRKLEVPEVDAPFAANSEVFAFKIRVFEFGGRERVVVKLRIFIAVLLECDDAFFERVDFLNGASQRKAE